MGLQDREYMHEPRERKPPPAVRLGTITPRPPGPASVPRPAAVTPWTRVLGLAATLAITIAVMVAMQTVTPQIYPWGYLILLTPVAVWMELRNKP